MASTHGARLAAALLRRGLAGTGEGAVSAFGKDSVRVTTTASSAATTSTFLRAQGARARFASASSSSLAEPIAEEGYETEANWQDNNRFYEEARANAGGRRLEENLVGALSLEPREGEEMDENVFVNVDGGRIDDGRYTQFVSRLTKEDIVILFHLRLTGHYSQEIY